MPASSHRSPHTLTEILSQPQVWREAQRELESNPAVRAVITAAASQKEWLFVGCGSSFYLAEAAAAAWMLFTGRRARAVPASELLLFPHLTQLDSQELHAVVISRSGRTSEAVRAAELLSKKHNLPTIALTCAHDSDLSKACNITIVLSSADEESMVMTRSFTSMLTALLHLASSQATSLSLSASFETICSAVSSQIHSWSQQVQSFVASREFADYIFLAQGPFYPIAREAALKITEMSGSYAQAYHTMEFRHGPKSIVGPQTCLMFFLSESGRDAESEVLAEMKQLGGETIAVCNRAAESVGRSADLLVDLNAHAAELALLAPFLVPAQLLAYHTSVKKGLNPDAPKNLTRVVVLD